VFDIWSRKKSARWLFGIRGFLEKMLSQAAKRGYNRGLSRLLISRLAEKKIIEGGVVFAGFFTIFC
jgi:hypothetical protein